jgi:hypothetical protein
MIERIGVYIVCGLFALMILILIVCEVHDLIKFIWSKLKNGIRKRV